MPIVDFFSQIGVGGALLAIALYALWKKWWVPGFMYDEKVKDNEELKQVIERMQQTQERGVGVVEHVAGKLTENAEMARENTR